MAGLDRVSLSADLAAPADAVWGLVRRFGDVAAWNPFLAESRIVGGEEGKLGAEREVVTIDGDAAREQLVELDEERRTLGYRMLTFPIPVVAQRNLVEVAAGGRDDRATVVFSADFEPAAGAQPAEIAAINQAAFTTAAKGLAASLNVDCVIS